MSHNVTPWNPSRRATARVKDALPAPAVCPHCGGEVKLVSNAEIYGREFGEWPWAFLCVGCRAYVGLHPFTGIPLGTLATAPMRDARQRAKAAFNPLWQSGRMSRTDAYAWLAKKLGVPPAECHIGMFDVPQCERVVNAVQASDAALSTAPTKERPINQCDGCRQGAPLRNGLHIDSNGRAFMACERDKYERRAAQPTGKTTDADGVRASEQGSTGETAMKYETHEMFRFINALQQAAMTAPYGAQIPRAALVEMIGVLTKHYDTAGPSAEAPRENCMSRWPWPQTADGVQEDQRG